MLKYGQCFIKEMQMAMLPTGTLCLCKNSSFKLLTASVFDRVLPSSEVSLLYLSRNLLTERTPQGGFIRA